VELYFWIAVLWVAYIYVGYPVLLKFLPKLPVQNPIGMESYAPKVSILIAAFNEAGVIEATINNKLRQNYPAELLQIIVISDESEDGTDEIVKAMAAKDSRIRLIRQAPRQGKTSGLNLAMPSATGDIIIFSDANSHYHPSALQEMINCFKDPEVGYVTGKMVYTNQDGSLVGDGCSAYMKYENYMRRLETQIGSIVGVDGGVDAIRKSLYQPMNADQLPDFVQPLKVVTQKKRVIFCEAALLHEEALSNSTSEFRMRVRVSLRAYWAMWDMKHLFNPFEYKLFSLQLFSHKLLRYLAFIPLMLALISNLFLLNHGWVYFLALIAQMSFYLMAIFVHWVRGSHNKLFGLAHYFCLINVASAIAFFKFLKGDKIVMWKPRVG
jgi:cellulose synthase/poly-beta-1,6-N-acetylglucosamine synthase-like glycosyltransferase